jgi:D-cysteine desulfhydrase family pyridoxal phosphate-dependent enzyme
LGALPTPVHPWRRVPGVPAGVRLWIKRDDMSGCTLSGNKVRKLEFLFADAMAAGADTVITVGGIQSNHARATAAAAAEAGLACHLILRASAAVADAADPGLAGNLLVERLSGAHVHLVSKAEYGRHGGPGLTATLADRLRAGGAKPYVIPVGGSNAVGAWGYLAAVTELEAGVPGAAVPTPWDDLVLACGSGGSVAGLAAGVAAAGLPARIHAYGVCDDPAYFEAFVRDEHLVPMGVPDAAAVAAGVRFIQAKGAGYAIPRPEELDTVAAVARETGIITDATYTGKALHAFLADVAAAPADWEGRHVLFIHTGGLLSLYDQAGDLEGRVRGLDRVERMRGL